MSVGASPVPHGAGIPGAGIALFADGADLAGIRSLAADDRVGGFTTNPTLMRKAGVVDYVSFAQEAAAIVAPRSLSLEVFADDLGNIIRQGRIISSWGRNVYVKVPVTLTDGTATTEAISTLSGEGVQLNVTALTTLEQVARVTDELTAGVPSIVSVFAGRIADAGVDPVPLMSAASILTARLPGCDLLWASSREVLNITQARQSGCQIITLTSDLWAKLGLVGRPLPEVSLDTVRMFARDAEQAGYQL